MSEDIRRYLNILNESLNEAPIDNFELVGDFNKNSSFRHEQDRKILTNAKAVQKIIAKWEKTPVDFNMYFVNSPEANRHTEIGMVDQQWLETNMPKTLPAIQINPQQVNVIFTNNKGSERAPMTGWVIAHRFGHAVSRYGRGYNQGRQMPQFTEARDILLTGTKQVFEIGYDHERGLPRHERDYQAMGAYDKMFTRFYEQIGTMKSAREGNLRNEFEFILELLAQYMLTGSIKFNPLPPLVKGSIGGNRTSLYLTRDEHDQAYANQVLTDTAEQLEERFEALLHACVGRVFVM